MSNRRRLPNGHQAPPMPRAMASRAESARTSRRELCGYLAATMVGLVLDWIFRVSAFMVVMAALVVVLGATLHVGWLAEYARGRMWRKATALLTSLTLSALMGIAIAFTFGEVPAIAVKFEGVINDPYDAQNLNIENASDITVHDFEAVLTS
jgi:hypothetical protein